MTEREILEAKRAYFRDWKRKNPEKVREANRRYWARYAERKAAQQTHERLGINDECNGQPSA